MDIIYPKKVLPTLFKNSLNYISDDEINSFKHFSEDLIKLKRDEYKKIIMAMRQYYNSIFLVNLNIDLAYTSFVAIIESLTQKLDEYTPIWEDYPEKARKSLDKVLQRLEENDSEEIKNLLLEYSHNKLASRYFNFCKDAVELDYYMEYAMDIKYPCTHIEIEDAIRNSYKVRSKYIHELENLPIEFTWNYEREICSIKGKSYFTFEGIVRFIRYLIIKLVNKLEKVSKENIDYFDELPGTHTASLIDDFAPQHWISNEQLYNIELSVSYLNGLLSIISSGRFEKEKRLPNLVGVCDKVEKLLKGINNNEKKQLPLIMLYAVYNKLVVEESRSKNYVNVIEKYRDLIEKPSIESLSYYLVSGNYIPWGIEKIIEIYDAYEKTRNKKGSIELGGTNETILLTTIINNYSEIDEDLYKKYLSKLVGIHPGNKYISSIFNNFVENQNMGKIQLEKIYGI